MTITGFIGTYRNGVSAQIDAHGNNAAFLCNKCDHPVLAIAREHQRGSSTKNPAICLGCGERFIIEPQESTKNIIISNISELQEVTPVDSDSQKTSHNITVSFADIELAFDFASAGQPFESEAYVNLHTGETYFYSDYCDTEEALPEDIKDDTKYIALPHKNDLDLGKSLAINFSYEFLPDDIEKIQSIFHKKGAYSRFKDLLEERDALDKWYDYENNETEKALREWCAENDIKING